VPGGGSTAEKPTYLVRVRVRVRGMVRVRVRVRVRTAEKPTNLGLG